MLIKFRWWLVPALSCRAQNEDPAASLAVGCGHSLEMQLEALCGRLRKTALQESGWGLVSTPDDGGHVGIGRGPDVWNPQPHLGQSTWTLINLGEDCLLSGLGHCSLGCSVTCGWMILINTQGETMLSARLER